MRLLDGESMCAELSLNREIGIEAVLLLRKNMAIIIGENQYETAMYVKPSARFCKDEEPKRPIVIELFKN